MTADDIRKILDYIDHEIDDRKEEIKSYGKYADLIDELDQLRTDRSYYTYRLTLAIKYGKA